MTMESPFHGSLFAEDFLSHSIQALDDWNAIDDGQLGDLEADLRGIFNGFPVDRSPNESHTENDLIWPVLKRLGWTESLRQQNLSARGREDVPDGILYIHRSAKDRANQVAEGPQRYEHGHVVVESKRWLRPLGQRSGRKGEESAPATQMLRYLRRIDDLTTGNLRWGILTNGGYWRLYWSGARSVSEQFFEINLAAILNVPGHNDGLFELSDDDRRHWLKVFVLIFRRDAFLPGKADGQTFHESTLKESRFHQERVSASISDLVFEQVFPDLARSLASAEPDTPLSEVRDAALILLYRLLFILYAEDRDLLPVRDSRYDDYALRHRVRADIGKRKDEGDVFSDTAARYWSAFDDLCRAINGGDDSIGLPPYNGGLFDRERTPLLSRVRLGDAAMADAIDALSFERKSKGRRYVNYRDLGVQQLGSIYERLLEQEVVRDGNDIAVRPNIFVRKDSGSYYTPDDLVSLVVKETLEPLASRRMEAFNAELERLASNETRDDASLDCLKALDPAERLLELKVCDPAMGSGHFLVNLVDHLADLVIAAMAEAESAADGYVSPLAGRVDGIRNTIKANAEERDWTFDPAQLDDRHIVRRMVLKRCVYGVDKNPMAVELAKVSLWLHTFTVGAPLSFLDHHLRCGDSLFGSWVRGGMEKAEERGGALFPRDLVRRAVGAAVPMQVIEGLTDTEIAEAQRSANGFAEVEVRTSPLSAFLSLINAFDWLNLRSRTDKLALSAYFDGQYGDPIDIACRNIQPDTELAEGERFAELLGEARQLIDGQRFLHWQVAFPGVWSDWEASELRGGFDAVIGNPPWDRMKLQQVEWFAARRPDVAKAGRAADRKRMIADLKKTNDPLADDYAVASERAKTAAKMARRSGDYPLLSRGDLNIYSLFIERSMTLVKPDGMVGLLTPSGIASDKTASRFFKSVATKGRLKALYDFENKKIFFPDVHASFKFCAFVASPSPLPDPPRCAFFLHDMSELKDSERCFLLGAADFARVNPNTGTAPIFRNRRDAELTTAIYDRQPVLVDRSSGKEVKAWPVKYNRMFDMTNDSGLFRTREELEEKEGAWPIGGNRFDSPAGQWVPLYEGKMVQAFDHRAASIVVNPANLHRPAQPKSATPEKKQNPNWLPDPQYWVLTLECGWPPNAGWVLGFKEITAPTNVRTFIAAIFPAVGFGNKVPVLKPEVSKRSEWLLAANLNATIFDFVTRQKVQGQTLNLFIVEQLPVVLPERYDSAYFGPKTAAEIVREAVLELTYTARDMAPFARDMGHVNDAGEVLPPFRWDEKRRLRLRAKLDALYFHLYGITNRDDIRYIYSTFPIVERDDVKAHGRYLSRDLCLAYFNALGAGNPDAEVSL